LDAEKTGRSPRTGLVLSSRRCTRRLLRLRRCRILAFTRNPFLLVVMMRCYFIQHRRNSKGFRVFQKNSKQKCDTFAWLRTRYKYPKRRGNLGLTQRASEIWLTLNRAIRFSVYPTSASWHHAGTATTSTIGSLISACGRYWTRACASWKKLRTEAGGNTERNVNRVRFAANAGCGV